MNPAPTRHISMRRGVRDGTAAPVPAATPRAIGKYKVIERLGAGAFGAVYRCHDPVLDRAVAVKVLGPAGEEALERFQREARAAARLSHPHIVPVFESGIDEEGRPFLVMEYVEGQSLDRLIDSPRLTLEATLRVVYHLAQALQAAHEQGVVHRDIKPANVLIDSEGRPRLTDFGLARLATDGAGLSRDGDLLGTPRYMSPEQALLAPSEVDDRTDIYSLGAMMYELLCGRPAAEGPNAMAVLRRITDEEPVPLRRHDERIPEDVAAICRRMMARDRDQRYQTARAVADEIQGFMLRKLLVAPEIELLAGLPSSALPSATAHRPRLSWAIAAGAAAVLMMVGFAAARITLQPAASTTTKAAVEVPALDLARVVEQSRADLLALADVADPRGYRERLAELLENLNLAVKSRGNDPMTRLARGKLLRRAGEYLAAVEDLEKAAPLGDPEVDLERCLARYQWEILALGSLAEAGLRPLPSTSFRADLARLGRSVDPAVKFAGRLAAALADGATAEAVRLAAERPERAADPLTADLLMLEADTFGRAAEAAHAESLAAAEAARDDIRDRRDDLDARAAQAVRRGLEASPHHPGLLFLKAGGWHRRVAWESADGEDQDKTIRRHRPGFEAAYQRFRSTSPRIGVEAATGRAVLLANYGRFDLALDQLAEASALRALPPAVAALQAWLQLHSPPDGELTAAYAGQVLQQLAPAFETPPDVFPPYLARALASASIGRWDEARRDLLDGKRLFRGSAWPPRSESFADWCKAVTAPPARFLDETIGVVWSLPSPADLRIRLQDELIKGLARANSPLRKGLGAEDLQVLAARGHYRLARFWAEKDDRANVLKHTRLALACHVPGVDVSAFQDDPLIKAWNYEDDFIRLYAEFEKK